MKISRNILLSKETTFKVGGRACYFSKITSVKDLKEAVKFIKVNRLLFFVLGGGSNVLFNDNGFEGFIIKIAIKGVEHQKIEKEKFLVTVGAGENWNKFVLKTIFEGFYGLENLSGIPGSVGASPIQNIGAYGTEVKNLISWVEVFDFKSGQILRLKNKECRFEYRDSIFKKPAGKNYIVLKVAFILSSKFKPNIKYKDLTKYFSNKTNKEITPLLVRKAVLSIRRKKLPDLKKYGTAGSFFKNPSISKSSFNTLKNKYPNLPGYKDGKKIKLSLAFILDKILNLHGFSGEKVKLYEKQPLVVVCLDNAKSKDIKKLAEDVRKKIFTKTKIKVQFEVNVL